jgi:peptidoglycan/xylan/chitin deacetylase (PgdA/CDA1 family)
MAQRNKLRLVLLAVLLLGIFILGAYYFWLAPKYTVPILMYHSIGYEEGSFFVSPENFNRQMRYLKDKGYEVISLDELVKSIESKKRVRRNKVVITFDDGYKDNFTYAYPVLKRYNFPATIFLITDYIGTKSNPGEKEFMLWEDVVVMSNNGISFGGHTKSHITLGLMVDEKQAFEEIAGSKEALEKKIDGRVDYFCYPVGAFNERIKELVRKAGYKGACATNRGYVKYNRDVYELKRIKVTNSDTNKPFSFWAKLSGYYMLFDRERSPY